MAVVETLTGIPFWKLTSPPRLTIGLALVLNTLVCGVHSLWFQ